MATLSVQTAADFNYAIPEYWAETLYFDNIRKAFWDKFEGSEGSNQPIIRKDSPLSKNGDVVHMTTVTNLRNAGVSGTSTLAGNEGKLSLGQFDLTVSRIRNAVAYDKQADEETFFDVSMVINQQLSSWLALKRDRDLFAQLLTTESPVQFWANNRLSDATLVSTDTFGTNELDMLNLALDRKGAEPISTVVDGKQEMGVYGVVITPEDAYHLRGDSRWVNAQTYAGVRGDGNRLFKGAFGMWNNMIVYVYGGIRGDAGTPLRPETKTVGTHTDSVATLTVGADDTVDYTAFFPSTGTLKITHGTSGTVEFVTYTGKTDYTFTGLTRGATYAGVATSGMAISAGSIVTLGNDMSKQIAFGSEVALRSWAKKPEPITQTEDYGFERGLGIEAVYGQKAVVQVDGVPPNYVVCHSYADTSSIGIKV